MFFFFEGVKDWKSHNRNIYCYFSALLLVLMKVMEKATATPMFLWMMEMLQILLITQARQISQWQDFFFFS